MSDMNEAISTAVKVQAAREGISLSKVFESIGMSRTSFWERLGGKRPWDTDDFDKLASALNLESAWSLIDIAKNEQLIAEQRVTA